jgi:hypothetical protein
MNTDEVILLKATAQPGAVKLTWSVSSTAYLQSFVIVVTQDGEVKNRITVPVNLREATIACEGTGYVFNVEAIVAQGGKVIACDPLPVAPPPPPPPSGFMPGVNAGYEPLDQQAVSELGAKLVRAEIGASQLSLAPGLIELWAGKGVKVCLLVSFDGSMISPAECVQLGPLAEKFAANLAAIEIGNETSYGYQYNDGYTDASYKERARTYATRVREAAEACSPHGVGVTCQASDGGSGSPVWVNEMFAAEPELAKYAGSFLGHFYPADGIGELKRMIADLKPYPGASSVPIDCTEFGWNGVAGVSPEQAAKDIAAYVPEYRSACEGRARIMTLYQDRDQSPSAPADERSWGAVGHEAQAKPPYTAAVQKFLAL